MPLQNLYKQMSTTKAVVAHVIKENISGNGVDMSVLEAEMAKLAYQFSLEMTSVIEKHLPSILESISNELRMKADEMYKKEISKKKKNIKKDTLPAIPFHYDFYMVYWEDIQSDSKVH